ncbi:O-phosphoseryl-tRNA(Sec) selenium transferase [Oesophagostomum dentatum]|uniref:O-phosphoseryl-tRNA(Sec) selenium transferase n=1 Tax=Oesophagostomum dentatum TaxID=61180 RepID=A0A0B1T4H9_OESDE|nr:O-phosphoseryl-tRNA(Sec) selenium transferase [Oesophagostomum dentatum]
MALSLCMGAWRKSRPHAKYVVWLRVDQKSCFKSILHAGFEPIILDPIREGDALVTDVETMNMILEKRAEEILCVMSTTSCFAPRSPDSLEAISGICQMHNVPHLVNNAYGLQSEECVRRLVAGRAAGRIDAFVQSLDKNFQVPVGGAIIATFKQSAILPIAQFYPGRGSCVPSRDLVLTLLSQGVKGLMEGYEHQKRLFLKMKRRLTLFANEIGECVYEVDDNLISLALTLSSIPKEKQTLFGSILFSRGVSGARVIASTAANTTIEGYEFTNFGSHCSEQHGGYLNIACGVGMTDAELDELFSRLATTYAKFSRQNGLFVPQSDPLAYTDSDE